jgi:hypothetical protein
MLAYYGFAQTKNINNSYKGTTWLLFPKIIGIDENEKEFKLIKSKQGDFGNFLFFIDSVNFVSYNSGECGNECRSKLFGKYKLEKSNFIIMYADSIVFWKECAVKPKKVLKKPIGAFNIEIKGDTVVFKKF